MYSQVCKERRERLLSCRRASKKCKTTTTLKLIQFDEAANVTLLDESINGPFEHSFDSECYQIKVKEQLKKYKNWQSLNDAKK